MIFYKGIEKNIPIKKETDSFYITNDSGKIYFNDNVWDSRKNVPYDYSLKTNETENSLDLITNKSNIILSYPKIKYEIFYNLNGCNINNKITEINAGGQYKGTLSFDFENYNILNDIISVGGIDKTNECFNYKTNEISLNDINGNVYISFNVINKSNDYIRVENFTKNSGNAITLKQEGDYVVATVTGGSTSFWVTSSSYFNGAKNCKLIVDELIVTDLNGKTIPLPGYVGFYKYNSIFDWTYSMETNFMPTTTSSGSNGRASFGTSLLYGLGGGGSIILKFKAKLLYS